MSPEKQRIAILEFCGWKRDKDFDFKTSYETVEIWSNGSRLSRFENLPDYLNDLNAMHEAEKTIPAHLRWQYSSNVTDIVRRCAREAYDFIFMSSLTATAPQRAEAFLRTVGKWEES